MTDAPGFIRNGRLDILAVDILGRALYAPLFDTAVEPLSIARFQFLHPCGADFSTDRGISVGTDGLSLLAACAVTERTPRTARRTPA
ncbi:MmyB family transcriptional regulator [Streptomyces fagopyri]|uniref:MmyB family transcriptional regulator n=1 Tax=Streptomyces fagopyri TaxID=2662397 RepID=UPI002AD36E2D|nr:hypothetical protein [Streptomyces fagopyri]